MRRARRRAGDGGHVGRKSGQLRRCGRGGGATACLHGLAAMHARTLRRRPLGVGACRRLRRRRLREEDEARRHDAGAGAAARGVCHVHDARGSLAEEGGVPLGELGHRCERRDGDESDARRRGGVVQPEQHLAHRLERLLLGRLGRRHAAAAAEAEGRGGGGCGRGRDDGRPRRSSHPRRAAEAPLGGDLRPLRCGRGGVAVRRPRAPGRFDGARHPRARWAAGGGAAAGWRRGGGEGRAEPGARAGTLR
mmetsp:Transcript_44558/g.148709  ORF Transcript_44558/g.148709 Transcript_44558/m.148709 type:complete len:250 (-) Transcript_44558:532-1281(-)